MSFLGIPASIVIISRCKLRIDYTINRTPASPRNFDLRLYQHAFAHKLTPIYMYILALFHCPEAADLISPSLLVTMKLPNACLFLGVVMANPVPNASPSRDIQGTEDKYDVTPSVTMIFVKPAAGRTNRTHHHPWHHEGEHDHRREHVSILLRRVVSWITDEGEQIEMGYHCYDG